jgi:hypothetical protein
MSWSLDHLPLWQCGAFPKRQTCRQSNWPCRHPCLDNKGKCERRVQFLFIWNVRVSKEILAASSSKNTQLSQKYVPLCQIGNRLLHSASPGHVY